MAISSWLTLDCLRKTFRDRKTPKVFAALQNTWVPKYCSVKDMAKQQIGGPLAPSSTRCLLVCLPFTVKTGISSTRTSSTENQKWITISWCQKPGICAPACWKKTPPRDLEAAKPMLKKLSAILGSSASTGKKSREKSFSLHINPNWTLITMWSTSPQSSQTWSAAPKIWSRSRQKGVTSSSTSVIQKMERNLKWPNFDKLVN